MAIAAACVWEVRPSTGNDNNGGGYVPGAGVDYSQQDAPQLSVTDAAATGTTNLSSATGGFTSNMVNSIVNVVGQGRRQITAFVDGNNVTCDAVWGTFSGATANVGGAVASPAILGAVVVNGNVIYQKGTYTVTVNTNNVSNGKLNVASAQISYRGYGTTRGDEVQATFTASGSITSNYFQLAAGGEVRDIHFNVNNVNTYVNTEVATRCQFSGFSTSHTGHVVTNILDCYIHGTVNAGYMTSCAKAINSTFKSTSASDATLVSISTRHGCAINCVFWGTGNNRVQVGERCIFAINCLFKGTRWFTGTSSNQQNCINCIFTDITSTAISNASTVVNASYVKNTAFRNNTSNYSAAFTGYGDIALTADPWVDAANGDFRLNSTAGGGALLRSMGFPTVFPGLSSTTTSNDVGPAQAAPGGGVSRAAVVNK